MVSSDSSWGPVPAGVDLEQDASPQITIVVVVLLVIAAITVVLRLISRRLVGINLWWDDWLILLALASDLVWSVMASPLMVRAGLGKHVWVTAPNSLYIINQAIFVQEIFYGIAQLSMKSSLIALLLRLFKPGGIALKLYITLGFLVTWFIVWEITNIFACIPINSSWERFNPNHLTKVANCKLATIAAGVSTSVFNPLFDLILMGIPLPHIWHIQAPRAQKLGLMAIFAVGLFVTCVSILRIYFISHLPLPSMDISWAVVNANIWTAVELNVGIICACLPLLRPLFFRVSRGALSSHSRRVQESGPTMPSWYRTKPQTGTKLESEDREDFLRQDRANENENRIQTRIEKLENGPEIELRNLDAEHGIIVKTDICVGRAGRGDQSWV